MERLITTDSHDLHGCLDAFQAANALKKRHSQNTVDIEVPAQDTDRDERTIQISYASEVALTEFLAEQARIRRSRIERGVAV